MKRPKPFFRRFTQSWYVQIGNQQINLGRDRKLAWVKCHQLMANREAVREQVTTVAQLFDVYLEWCSTRRSPGTYRNTRLYLRSFIDCVGTRLSVAKLKPLHISNWMDAHSDWTDTTRNDAISIAQRPLNWVVSSTNCFPRGTTPQSQRHCQLDGSGKLFRVRSQTNRVAGQVFNVPDRKSVV